MELAAAKDAARRAAASAHFRQTESKTASRSDKLRPALIVPMDPNSSPFGFYLGNHPNEANKLLTFMQPSGPDGKPAARIRDYTATAIPVGDNEPQAFPNFVETDLRTRARETA